jgi:KDO2-lipid IV(A) lauroyltransferase
MAAQARSPETLAVRANQAVVRELEFDDPKLDQAVLEVYRNSARALADWYSIMARGPQGVREAVEFSPDLMQEIQANREDRRGLIIISAHMSSYNLAMLALGVMRLPIQGLSHAVVQGAVQIDNLVRRKFGVEITPISIQALRQALKRLREGGMVMTAVDRPDVGGEPLTFFGRPAKLPIGHARLALQTDSRIMVGMTQTIGEGRYRTVGFPPIEPNPSGDRQRDVFELAQQVLDVMETYIRTRPSEWLMFLPIWPDVIPVRY